MKDVIVIYIDNMMIFTKIDDSKKHAEIVKKVLQRLQENDLITKPEKHHFNVKEVKYLRMVVSSEGIKIDQKKVLTILDWPASTNVKGVRISLD